MTHSTMNYRYEYVWDETYCYPQSSVLRNRLNIIDSLELQEAERIITSLRILELREFPPLRKMDFEYLKLLHQHIFQDIFEWAGKIRTVNISKGNMFCPAINITNTSVGLFKKLENERYLTGIGPKEMPDKLAWYLSEINAIHPFREGNGRTQRLFIELLAQANGFEVDFSDVGSEEMIIASAEAFLGKYEKLNNLFRRIVSL